MEKANLRLITDDTFYPIVIEHVESEEDSTRKFSFRLHIQLINILIRIGQKTVNWIVDCFTISVAGKKKVIKSYYIDMDTGKMRVKKGAIEGNIALQISQKIN